MAGLVLDILIEWLGRMMLRAVAVVRSRNWPQMEASVLGADCPDAAVGCPVANVYYEYRVDDKKYDSVYKKPFFIDASGKQFAGQFRRGTKFSIRVNPQEPAVSVPWPASWPGKS